VSRYQKGKTDLDFTEARDSEWQCHQLRRMQVCTSLQTDNHASNPPLSFLQAGCPSCRPTNSVKALKANVHKIITKKFSSLLRYHFVDFIQADHICCHVLHDLQLLAVTIILQLQLFAFSALTLLTGRVEEHPACKN